MVIIQGIYINLLILRKNVTVIYNSSDKYDLFAGHTHFRTSGIASYAVIFCSISKEIPIKYVKMAKLVDEYIYGFPTEKTFLFRYGIDTFEGDTYLDKVQSILNYDVKTLCEREQNLLLAQEQFNKSQEYTILGNKIHPVVGQSPIIDTFMLLSQPTGIGMLIRYENNKTYLSFRVSKESKLNAGELMTKFIGGGGSIDVIIPINELFQ